MARRARGRTGALPMRGDVLPEFRTCVAVNAYCSNLPCGRNAPPAAFRSGRLLSTFSILARREASLATSARHFKIVGFRVGVFVMLCNKKLSYPPVSLPPIPLVIACSNCSRGVDFLFSVTATAGAFVSVFIPKTDSKMTLF